MKLVVDEYGPWYRPGTALDPTHLLGQQVTLRDAILTAFTLDIFNRNAEKVGMAANAQLVNCLNALFFTHEDKFVVTPNFYVFLMYAAHQGAQAVRAEFSAPEISYQRDGKTAGMWGLKGSASRKGNTLTLTVARTWPVVLVSLVAFLIIGPYSFLGGAMALDFGGKQGAGTASGVIDGVGYLGGVLSGDTVARVSVAFGWGGVFVVLAVVAFLTAAAGAVFWIQEARPQS